MPDSEQRKLALQPFNGEEVYVSLGSGFHERHKKNSIVRDVSEFACGFVWAAYIKTDVLKKQLMVTVQAFYRLRVEIGGWKIHPWSKQCRGTSDILQQDDACSEHKVVYGTNGTKSELERSFLYLAAVSNAGGGGYNLVLDNIIHSANVLMYIMILID